MENTSMLGGLIFFAAFIGLVLVHEFGHFIVSRLFKVEVEEFGIGLPPRMLRLWRARGRIQIGARQIRLPANFDLPIEAVDLAGRSVLATADQVDDRLVLRTIAFTDEPGPTAPAAESFVAVESGRQYLVDVEEPAPAPATRGAVEITGVVAHIEPGTEYTLNWLPIGGFVRPKGENDPAVAGGLAAAKPGVRLAVMFAGPVMNLLAAAIIFSVVIRMNGIPVPGTVIIDDVSANSPAETAGLQNQDVILSIAGEPVTEIGAATSLIRDHLDRPIEILVERDGQELAISATPLSSRSVQQGALGIRLTYPTRPVGPGEALWLGFVGTGDQIRGFIYLPVALVRGQIAPDEARLSGLKGIYDLVVLTVQRDTETRQPVAGNQPVEQPTNWTLMLIGSLSVSLGIINLFPFPALDGGRILFVLPELIFRRRVPHRFENAVHAIGMLILLALMLYVNIMDFVNPANFNLP